MKGSLTSTADLAVEHGTASLFTLGANPKGELIRVLVNAQADQRSAKDVGNDIQGLIDHDL